MADRFDHFNRDGLVELTAEIAIVLEQHCDSIRESLLRDFFRRVVVLRAGDCSGGYAASVVAGGVNRKAAPSRANFEQMIVRAKIEFAADSIYFGDSRFLERRIGTGKDRARVHQGGVEDELEEIVAEVVVRGDVALTARPGIAIEVVQQPAGRIRKPREA